MTLQEFLSHQFPYATWYREVVGGAYPWQYAVSRDKGGVIRGVLPFQVKKRWGLDVITPPPHSPRLGPYLSYPKDCISFRQRQTYQYKVLTELAEKLPKVAYAKIHWPYDLTFGLPWQQLGWQQTVRYSYTIDLSSTLETIHSQFKGSLRNKIRKAERQLEVVESSDYQTVFRLCQLDFAHRKVPSQIGEQLFTQLDTAATQAQARKIWLAQDDQGRTHAAIWVLFDEAWAYNLFLGSDPQLRSSGATTLLLWTAIQWAKQAGLAQFDFEGSHLPGVEPFFRSFGGEARPYYQFTKSKSWLRPFL
ncbi:MAG: GNAT family N-acetyltransferase [Bacteroidota bacterium]